MSSQTFSDLAAFDIVYNRLSSDPLETSNCESSSSGIQRNATDYINAHMYSRPLTKTTGANFLCDQSRNISNRHGKTQAPRVLISKVVVRYKDSVPGLSAWKLGRSDEFGNPESEEMERRSVLNVCCITRLLLSFRVIMVNTQDSWKGVLT